MNMDLCSQHTCLKEDRINHIREDPWSSLKSRTLKKGKDWVSLTTYQVDIL